MKKTAIVLIVLLLMLCLCGCKAEQKNGIAFIGGPSGIDDRYEVQAVRTAVKEYCDSKRIPYFEYVSDGSDGFFDRAVAQAAANCKLVVCDSTASAAVSQTAYEELSFLLVNYSGSVAANARAISFCEEDAAFMAGYVVAADGNTKLGFLGGSDSDINRHYLNGFAQGLEAAAGDSNVELVYYFTGSDEATDEAQNIARDMFMSGCDIVFVCGGNIYKSAVQAANVTRKFLVGGEMDQAGESERFTTTAVKNYATVFAAEIDGFMENNGWKDGFAASSVVYGYSHGAVGIPTYTGAFRFKNITPDDFAAFAARFSASEFEVKRSASIPASGQHITVTEYTKKEQ